MIVMIFWRLFAIDGLITHIIKLFINVNWPLFLLITLATKLKLKNKYRIGDKIDF